MMPKILIFSLALFYGCRFTMQTAMTAKYLHNTPFIIKNDSLYYNNQHITDSMAITHQKERWTFQKKIILCNKYNQTTPKDTFYLFTCKIPKKGDRGKATYAKLEALWRVFEAEKMRCFPY